MSVVDDRPVDQRSLVLDAIWRMEGLYKRVAELRWQAALDRAMGRGGASEQRSAAADELESALHRVESALAAARSNTLVGAAAGAAEEQPDA